MVPLILLIDRLAPLIYLTLFFGILTAMVVFFSAQRAVARTQNYVPREEASARAYRAGLLAMGLLLLVVAVALVDTRVAPMLASPSEQESDTNSPQTQGMVLTSTLTPTPTLERTIIEISTLTPSPQPQATPPPHSPATCPNPGVHITSPGPGANLQGSVEVRGTAAINNFWYYKLEWGNGPNPSNWYWITAGHQPVPEGFLGSWDTSPLSAGIYTLRLVVVDHTGNFPEPCQVMVNINY